MKDMKKVLVTGAAGFIGSHLTERLLKDGYEVTCVDNLNEYYDVTLKEARLARFEDRVRFEKVDVQDHDALVRIMTDGEPEAVCHLAAQAGVRYSLEHPLTYGESNVQGTLSVLEAAKKAGVTCIVMASSSSVYGESEEVPFREDMTADQPISVYAATKRATELIAHAYHHLHGMDIACLRFFTVYGPYGRPDMALFKFAKAMLAGEPIDVYNNGQMRRDFTYVDDIVEGFVAALKKPKGYQIYNLGHGHPVGLLDFIKVLEKELGREATLTMLPMQQGDVPQTYADTTKAKQDLGFEATIPVEEGVKRFVAWYKEYYNVS